MPGRRIPAENKYRMRLIAIDPEELERLTAVDRKEAATFPSLSP
ncbi:hypothetical protein [Sinorhizobium sp. CCBAU 05631]|nr:hypothetical protein [Sinorhizobium sp. CCBAU 05631]ASY59234.1 hypothetical protein SS05631_b51420 [Sinorhizobium sp. CCBAU 05631]